MVTKLSGYVLRVLVCHCRWPLASSGWPLKQQFCFKSKYGQAYKILEQNSEFLQGQKGYHNSVTNFNFCGNSSGTTRKKHKAFLFGCPSAFREPDMGFEFHRNPMRLTRRGALGKGLVRAPLSSDVSSWYDDLTAELAVPMHALHTLFLLLGHPDVSIYVLFSGIK